MSSPDVTLSLPFTETEIEGMVADAIIKVFDTMLSISVTHKDTVCYTSSPGEERRPAEPIPLDSNEPVIASAVGFIGTVNGVLYLYFSDSVATKIACSFLGMDRAELEEEGPETVSDTLGELANVSVGTFKNKMCDKGYNCRLTIPSILRGQHFTIESTSSVLRKVYRFQYDDSIFAVDLLMKPGE